MITLDLPVTPALAAARERLARAVALLDADLAAAARVRIADAVVSYGLTLPKAQCDAFFSFNLDAVIDVECRPAFDAGLLPKPARIATLH